MFELANLPRAQAGMISTATVVTNLNRVESQQTITQFLGRDDVKSQLAKAGVSSEEASMRLAALSDFEVKNLASQIQANQVGGDVLVIGLGTVLLVIIILLLLRRI
jgi:hypothetical protein